MNAAKKTSNNENNTIDHLQSDESVLLPGLPNHLAHLCLSALPPSLLYRVCIPWRRLIYSPDFPPFLSLYALLARASPMAECATHSVGFFCFDPVAWKWRHLPSPPSDPPLCMLSRHSSFISRILPVQSIASSNQLVLIAANTHKFLPALARPLVFDPSSSKWSFGPPLSAPRRWCATGSMDGVVYVASGVGAKYCGDVARSLEKWDVSKKEGEWSWENRAGLKDGRFSREAIEAVGYRGKLCMVNVKGKVRKDGAVYDVVGDRWEGMPEGMLRGWNGPAAVDDHGDMYVVDQESGCLSKYDGDKDCWDEVTGPSEYLKGAEHICAGRGRVCAVAADSGKIVVVDVVGLRGPTVSRLDAPKGMEVMAVHLLPRMSLLES